MIESGRSMLQVAGTTAFVGMGVVFSALFLLAAYMHVFKGFLVRLEARRGPSLPVAPKHAPRPAPRLSPVPVPPEGTNDAAVAAAIAVGLRLQGVGGELSTEVAAAIATALCLEQTRGRGATLPPHPVGAPWSMAGRIALMTSRVRRQER